MTTLRASASRRKIARLGWMILVALSGLLLLNGLLLYMVIVDTAQEQTLAILLAGFGVLSFAVAFRGLRRGSAWSWKTMWIVVGLLGVIALHMFSVGRLDIGAFYLVLAVLALLGQMFVRWGGTHGH